MKKKKIAVVIDSVMTQDRRQMMKGLLAETKKIPADLFVFPVKTGLNEIVRHQEGDYRMDQLIPFSLFDGVIFFANTIHEWRIRERIIRAIRESKVPAVSVGDRIEGFLRICVENYETMSQLVTYFISACGFSRIAYVDGWKEHTDMQERFAAYRDVMKKHQIVLEEQQIFRMATDGKKEALEMLRRREEEGIPLPQAVICATYELAEQVCRVFGEHGVNIPKDLRISSFGSAFEASTLIPGFVAVEKKHFQFGENIARRLFLLMEETKEAVMQECRTACIVMESSATGGQWEEDCERIQNQYLDEILSYEHYLEYSHKMVSELNEVQDFRDFVEKLQRFQPAIHTTECYVCLDKKMCDDLSGGLQEENFWAEDTRLQNVRTWMAVVAAYRNGRAVQCRDFEVGETFPWTVCDEKEGKCYLLYPIYFQDHCKGYAVVANQEFPFSLSFLELQLLHMGDTLEHLYKQIQLQNMLKQLDEMYVRDTLTGLYNRFGFARYAGEQFVENVKQGKQLMVLFVDMDGLKKINDHYGHDKGDAAIQAIAYAIKKSCLRDEVCARFGGDEYVVYAQGYGEEEAEAFCERLQIQLQEQNKRLAQGFCVEISYGYKIFSPKEGDVIDSYIDETDQLMYEMKMKKKSEKSVN